MSWKNVKLIFLREVRDQLRDRRTLFMVAVLPLLLYPSLGIGMVQMTLTFAEQTRRVVLVGASQLPEPSLLDGENFDPRYFDQSADVEKLQLVTDRPGGLEVLTDAVERQKLAEFLKEVESRRDSIDRLATIQRDLDQMRGDDPAAQPLLVEQRQLRHDIESWFASAPAQVLIVFPRDFREKFDRINDLLSQRALSETDAVAIPRPVILHNSANEKSEIAYQRVRRALQNWEDLLLEWRLRNAQLPSTLPNPVPLTAVDLAEPEQIAANVWSKIFPALLVIMAVTGAFYPAIDLGAGEKERGTMETLLISPATRTEIVLGKFLTVMLFSFTTALLNLTSMGFTGRHMLSAVGGAKSSPLGDLSFPPLASLTWVILLAIPLAALFSALSLSFAMFARSSKEGQYYLTPLLLVTMGLTVFCLNPIVELNAYYSILPVTGPALLLKALLLGGSSAVGAAPFALPVLVTSCGYSLLALWWATEQFKREDILFREAERFDLKLWVKHLLREKEPTPSFSEAAVGFLMIAILQFLFYTKLSGSEELLQQPWRMAITQLVYLIATVGAPPLLMAILLTSSFRRTLKLYWPGWKFLIMGSLLGLLLQPPAMQLISWLGPFLPEPPKGLEQMMNSMGTVPWWLSIAAFAVAPGVCEELAFRGFILSGLERSRRAWLPIVVSALLFGVIHLIPVQQVNASLLGLVLGLLAIRSKSLLPGVLFHIIFNGTQVLASQLKMEDLQRGWPRWFMQVKTVNGVPAADFQGWVLVMSSLLSAAMIFWLWKSRPREEFSPVPAEPTQA